MQNRQHNTEEEKNGELILLDFKTHCKATMFKAVWYWQRKKKTWNNGRIESPAIYKYSQLINDQGTKEIQCGGE